MAKRNISFPEFKAEFEKALKAHARAIAAVPTRFQAIVRIVREAGFEPLFCTPWEELEKEQKAMLAELRDIAAAAYNWKKERKGDYWRNLKYRIAKELAGDTQAGRSKAARDAAKEKSGKAGKANKASAGKASTDKRQPDTPAPIERTLPERLVMDMALALAEALPHVPEDVAAQIRACLQALEKEGVIEK